MIDLAPPSGARYRAARRRLLIDMHIPDWNPGFLSRYRPEQLAEAAAKTGADAVMLYFQSHVGLCYYPTEVGARHGATACRDLAGEALSALRADGIATCAYYSVNFNNRAWLDHPEWRLAPAAPAVVGPLPRERYGIVCLNHPDYRAFVDAQIDEIMAYPVDAMFFDMVWWNGVCVCPSCARRYRDEAAVDIPRSVDWRDPVWTRFQAARERWLAGFAVDLRARVRARRPEVEVYHNFALGLSNWTRGVSFDSIDGHDFLGGDFYGGAAEQLLITRLMRRATPKQPCEFMTTVATGLTDHVRLRSPAAMRRKALAALMADAAFLAIVAIDPSGEINSEALARVEQAFAAMRRYDGFAGGEPIEDVAVYCSDFSKMSAGDAARPLAEAPAASAPDYPHFEALVGACRILQRAHVPFGVATRRDLDQLARWPVLILPNVERMSAEEVAAFRSYVEEGGRLYASRASSLRDDGDFALSDIFGVQAEGEEKGRLVYVEIKGQLLAHPCRSDRRTGAMRIRSQTAETLATLTLPFGYPRGGTVEDHHWATIHASPPWEHTERPVITRNKIGSGLALYSAIDLEAGATPEHDELFLALLDELLPAKSITVETHPQVWLSGYSHPGQIVVMLLNYPPEDPGLPVASARVTVRLPEGATCRAVRSAPGLEPIAFTCKNGLISLEAGPIEELAMIVIEHDG